MMYQAEQPIFDEQPVPNRKKYTWILFDLDGTLTDPGQGIRNSVAYALDKMGLPRQTGQELNRFIGPPLQEGFRCLCGLDEKRVNEAVAKYREYYQERGIFENVPYPGVEQMLKTLKDNGRNLIVATSKPEVYARQILEHFRLAPYFTFIAGGNLDGSRCNKGEVIRYALEKCQIHESTCCLMVGDRKHDMIGAKSEGIATVGVFYGYGSKEELLMAGADALAEDVKDITAICLEKR